ncbi:MAG: TerC family protein [Chloroflexota bacterium]
MLENLLTYAASLMGIVVIDLVLSGDNALVIGMAARRLPSHRRRIAILLGGAGAIGLRVLFAAIATLLLAVPLLQAAGGALLLWIAWKLLRDHATTHEVAESISVLGALKTIILADVVMSLDNILAVAGASHGSIELLMFGLLLSMPLILFGSSLVATLMNRFSWLELVGAAVLTWTAGSMIVEDQIVGLLLQQEVVIAVLVPMALTALFLGPALSRVLPGGGEGESLAGRLGTALQLSPVVATLRRSGEQRTRK